MTRLANADDAELDRILAAEAADQQLEAAEKSLIDMALEKHNGVQTRAAKELGISERALRYKIKIKGDKKES